MDWIQSVQRALNYIEAHLFDEELDNETVAKEAYSSNANFQRIFSIVTGVTVADYIRCRKLTLAGEEFINSNVKVIDAALKYGYETPESFAKAFARFHGVTPSEARAGGVTLKAYSRISFQISVKGEKEMDYRIESKEAFQVFGYEGIFRTDGSGMNADILHDNAIYPNNPHELWNQNRASGAYEKLVAAAGDLPAFVHHGLCKVHGVCDYKQTEPGTFAYMQCAFRSKNSKIDGYAVADIPANTWVILPSEKFTWDKVVEVINNLNKRFYSEWLPTAEYEQANGMNFEVYGGDADLGYVELWYAVKKKA